MPNRVVRPTRGRLRALVLVVAAVTVLTGWLLAAPPGASPDDGYHLGSVWCAEGFKDGICVEDPASPDRSRVLVPQPVLEITCFTYVGSQSAACQLDALAGSMQRLARASTNINGERPSLYYRGMHQLIGDGQDVAAATSRIRTANVLVAILLTSLTAAVAHPRLRIAFLLSWSVAAVPLGLFLLTSLNTSAWGIAGLSTAWANIVTARDHPERNNRIAGSLLALVGLVLAFGARTESVAHTGIIAVALLAMWGLERFQRVDRRALLGDRRTVLRVAAAVTGVLIIAGVLVAIAPESAGLSGVVEDLREGYSRLAARDIGEPILAIAFEVPTLWAGALGNVWGLGALDTPIPSLSSFPLMGMFVGLAAIGLHGGRRGRVVAVTGLLVALLVFPTLSLLRAGLLVYEGLQPRQFMIILFPLLGIALYRLEGEQPFTLGLGGRITTVIALSSAHALALVVTIQRHTSGLLPGFLGEPRHIDFDRPLEWWWASAPHPTVVWLTASAAYAVAITVIVRAIPPSTGAAEPAADRSTSERPTQ